MICYPYNLRWAGVFYVRPRKMALRASFWWRLSFSLRLQYSVVSFSWAGFDGLARDILTLQETTIFAFFKWRPYSVPGSLHAGVRASPILARKFVLEAWRAHNLPTHYNGWRSRGNLGVQMRSFDTVFPSSSSRQRNPTTKRWQTMDGNGSKEQAHALENHAPQF
jgi:hypothetical protein